MKRALIIFVIVATVAALVFALLQTNKNPKTKVTNYEECVAAGYPVMESYPARCQTPDGKSFTQDIGNELDKNDLITLENPRPNQTIQSPLVIRGKARGQWFFEATFPVRLVDDNGKEIAQSFVQAQGEWMSEEFVTYEGKLEFTTSAKSGKLILEKSNPSGLAENEDKLEIPVKF